MSQPARLKWIENRVAESFGITEAVASDFLQRRDVASEVTGLLDGSGPSCLYFYYQPRDVCIEVRVWAALAPVGHAVAGS